MAREFVRKIRNVSTIQELRDWTNCMGDIVIKDEIYAYIRVAGEYKPISYPMIYDYKLPREEWSHGDYWLDAAGIHRRDRKINSQLKYDVTNGYIVCSIETNDLNSAVISFDNSNFSARVVTEDDNGLISNGYNQTTSNVSKDIEIRSKGDNNISGLNYNMYSNQLVTAITVHNINSIWTGKGQAQYNLSLTPDSNSFSIADNSSNILSLVQEKFNNEINQRYGSNAYIRNKITNTNTKLDVIADASNESLLTVKNKSNNGILLGGTSTNYPQLSFLLNNDLLTFSMQHTNNTDVFVIEGPTSYRNAFRQAIDELLGFTTTIESLRQEINSLKSRVTSLENRP